MEKVIKQIRERAGRSPRELRLYRDWFECLKLMYAEDKVRAWDCLAEYRKYLVRAMKHMHDVADLREVNHLQKESYHLEARDRFDSYLIFLEWNRAPESRFYLPRRKVIKVLVDDLQDLADRKIKFLGISLPPRVGKSTLCILFITWMMGRHPESANVMSGHSDKLTDGFYQEILNVITDHNTYLWQEVFPEVRMVDKSAKNETIDLGSRKRFPSLTCRSIEGTLTGAVEIGEEGVLYSDDLVADLEESLNPERLQNKYDAYLNQLKDRKKDGALELMVGTRWNVLDPLGRIADQYGDDPKYRFRVIPALNENDASNFEYDFGKGFSTAYYHDMRRSIDDATWWAKYMGQPYVREGLLFPRDSLQYYNGQLPGGEPDRVIAVIDVAWGGGDFLSMPIAYIYGADAYIHDVVFSSQNKSVTMPLVVGKVKQHGIHQIRVEANNGGSEFCAEVDAMLSREGISVNMGHRRAPTTQSKLSRIIQHAPEIQRLYFIDDKHRTDRAYRLFMQNLQGFVITGKNKNDDAPDSLAQLVEFLNSNYGVVTVFQRPI